MLPTRRLLYHRGVDDHIGTYVTDYVFCAILFLLCVQLFVRICYENTKIVQEQLITSSCWHVSNWLPWNWPKDKQSSVTMTTYALLLFGFSNSMMALLGGLTHQFLQEVEPYHDDVAESQGWLSVWRAGASFSAFLCLSLLTMTEQLVVQENIFRISRKVRIAYYVIILIGAVCLFCYNYVPLVGKYKDPFSISKAFIISFVVMFVYGITTIIVLACNICCRKSSFAEGIHFNSNSVENGHSEPQPRKDDIYSCCKKVVCRCHVKSEGSCRRWELILTVAAPWIFVSAGAINYLMKTKCADSDAAFSELGCPLPDFFNHNALMHIIQIISVSIFFVAENMAMTRRNDVDVSCIKRAVTSSTIYSDVINSSVTSYPESKQQNCTGTPTKRDDTIYKIEN